MEKVKVFHQGDPTELEKQVNAWIGEVSPNIKRVLQTQAGRYGELLTMTIFYENSVGTDLPLSEPGPDCKCAACYTV